MQFFSFLLLLLRVREQEALHHPDRRRKRREGERKKDCDGGIKGYPSLSVTSFIVPCSVLPAHPSSAVTHTNTHTEIQTHTFSPTFTHSTTTNTHQRRGGRHANFDSLSALFHTFMAMTHKRAHTNPTRTLPAPSFTRARFLPTVTATMTNTQRPESHTNFYSDPPPRFTHSATMTDTQTALSFTHSAATADSQTQPESLRKECARKQRRRIEVLLTRALVHVRTCLPSAFSQSRNATSTHKNTHTTQKDTLRPTSWILIRVCLRSDWFCSGFPRTRKQDARGTHPSHFLHFQTFNIWLEDPRCPLSNWLSSPDFLVHSRRMVSQAKS